MYTLILTFVLASASSMSGSYGSVEMLKVGDFYTESLCDDAKIRWERKVSGMDAKKSFALCVKTRGR